MTTTSVFIFVSVAFSLIGVLIHSRCMVYTTLENLFSLPQRLNDFPHSMFQKWYLLHYVLYWPSIFLVCLSWKLTSMVARLLEMVKCFLSLAFEKPSCMRTPSIFHVSNQLCLLSEGTFDKFAAFSQYMNIYNLFI